MQGGFAAGHLPYTLLRFLPGLPEAGLATLDGRRAVCTGPSGERLSPRTGGLAAVLDIWKVDVKARNCTVRCAGTFVGLSWAPESSQLCSAICVYCSALSPHRLYIAAVLSSEPTGTSM